MEVFATFVLGLLFVRHHRVVRYRVEVCFNNLVSLDKSWGAGTSWGFFFSKKAPPWHSECSSLNSTHQTGILYIYNYIYYVFMYIIIIFIQYIYIYIHVLFHICQYIYIFVFLIYIYRSVPTKLEIHSASVCLGGIFPKKIPSTASPVESCEQSEVINPESSKQLLAAKKWWK